MNFSFENSKRKVSLGGRSRVAESREEVLRRTHAERERRARERLEHKSGICIQAAWRRARAVAQLRRELRKNWRANYGEFGERLDRDAELTAALREVLYFINPEDLSDVELLAAIGQHILSTVNATGVPLIIDRAVNQAIEGSADSRLRLCRLLRLVIRSLRIHWQLLLPESADFHAPAKLKNVGKALLVIVVRLTDAHLWRRGGPSGTQQLGKMCRLLGCRSLFSDLASILTAVSMAAEAAHGGNPPATVARGGAANTSVTVNAQRSKAAYGATTAAMAAFVSQWAHSLVDDGNSGASGIVLTPLLCTPLLWTRCEGLRPSAVQLWVSVVKELSGLTDVVRHLPEDLANGKQGAATALLGNLAEAASFAHLDADSGGASVGQEALLAAAMGFSGVAWQLLEELPLQMLFPTKEELGLDDAEMVEANIGSGAVATWDEAAMNPLRAAAQIKSLVSLTTVRSLMNILVPAASEPAVLPQLPSAGSRIRAFCSLLSLPLSLPALQTKARLALAVTPELVPRLWHSYLKEGFREQDWGVPNNNSLDPGWMLPLLILCHCFSTFLLTSAESAFYEEQRPLPLAELYGAGGKTGLLGLLRDSLWQVLWLEQTRGRAALPSAAQDLRDAVRGALGRLLGQLYDRNCRRQFVPTEAFYAPQLGEDAFLAEVQGSLGRGPFLEAKQTRVWQLLRQAPFLVPFAARAAVFQNVVGADKEAFRGDQWAFRRPAPITIRRNEIFWDAFDQLNGRGEALRQRLQITFVDVHGMPEAGVDGGGLFKDLMENLVKQGFNPELGLFLATSDNRLYPNPNASLAMEQAISAFEFLGRMLGKAMYEGIIVELPLAPFFLKQLLRRGVDVNDLPTLDPEHYRNLMFLRTYEGDLEDLSLTFTITKDIYGDRQERELVPGGRNVPVTNANRAEYILRTANYRLNVETRQYTDAFRRGVYEVIEPEWVSMFNEAELQMLIRGRGAAGIDVEELRHNVNYAGGYFDEHPTIRAFWQALASFTPQQQAAWLKFVTACSRAPLLGFKHLSPQLCIAKAGQETDPASQERLPTSATCMNLLKLPPMKSPEQIAAKLLYAIENVSGFDLS